MPLSLRTLTAFSRHLSCSFWLLAYTIISSIILWTPSQPCSTCCITLWYISGAQLTPNIRRLYLNACTKSGSLRFSQFSGCWLILSVYIIMSFDFPFVRLFGVR
jgi:hypothetical protein